MNKHWRLGAAFILLSTALLSTSALAEAPFSFATTPGKLPKTVVPEHYALRVTPDLSNFTFEGEVSIKLRVDKKVNELVLNAAELEIVSAALTGAQRVELTAKLEPEQQLLRFKLPRPLAPGAYTLDIAYRGRINPQTNGFYYAHYNSTKGEKKLVLATQMEPADARRMLPCWDEPAFRAIFQTAVDLPAAMTPFSNTPVETVHTLPDGLVRTRFEPTPKMASYLLVLMAGDFERLAAKQDGVDLGIVTAAGKKKSGEYALKITGDLLRYYNDYFGVPYPLPKLDQFGVPSTSGFGAMENWGGIVYNEALLLFDPRTSADETRRYIFSVVAHEFAHQWFGDLVTMAWWDNLWLNEGFASWMADKAMDHFNPDWGVWHGAQDSREAAMSLDARSTTHPIQQPVRDESQANDAFDVITYEKGQSFLRMLETWLGADPFRDGLRAYMAKHQYSNTTTEDLWAALEQSSGKPVRRMAQGWTTEPGFPVVKVNARCDNGQRRISLKQEQFKVDGDAGKRLWAIPVAISAGGQTGYELLDKRTLELTRPGCDDAVLVDPNAVGYYRVEYAPELLTDLTARWSRLSVDARLKLLGDAWALAATGRTRFASYLALVEQARNDAEAAIWEKIVDRLYKLDDLARNEPMRADLRAFAIRVLRPKLDQLGWEPRKGDSQEVLELRPTLIAKLGEFGDAGVRAEARARFDRFVKDPASLPAALADPVTSIVGRTADAATWELLLNRTRTAPGSEEQRRYLAALTANEDPAMAKRTLELALGDTLPVALATSIPRRVAGEHLALAWDFAKREHRKLMERLVSLESNEYFGGVVGASADAAVASDLEMWAAKNLPKGAKTRTARIADGIRFNAKQKQRLLPQLAQALAAGEPAK